jgi:hypothetical protein
MHRERIEPALHLLQRERRAVEHRAVRDVARGAGLLDCLEGAHVAIADLDLPPLADRRPPPDGPAMTPAIEATLARGASIAER